MNLLPNFPGKWFIFMDAPGRGSLLPHTGLHIVVVQPLLLESASLPCAEICLPMRAIHHTSYCSQNHTLSSWVHLIALWDPRIQSSFHVKGVLNNLHSFICSSEEMSFRTLYLSFGDWLVKISHKLWSLESTTQNNEQRKEWTKLLSMYWCLGKQLCWQWFYCLFINSFTDTVKTHMSFHGKILWSPILPIPNSCSQVWRPGKRLYIQFSSVAQLCPTLCGPVNRSTPGLPVHAAVTGFILIPINWLSSLIKPIEMFLKPWLN